MSWEVWGDDESFFGPDWADKAADAGWLNPDDVSKAMIDLMNEVDRQWGEKETLAMKVEEGPRQILLRSAALIVLEIEEMDKKAQ